MYRYLLVISMIWGLSLGADLTFKEEIEKYESLVEKTPANLVQLAKAYLKDQEMEKGVKTFLEALDLQQDPSVAYQMDREEVSLYKEALQFYLSSQDFMKNSQRVLEEFGQVVENHPEYHVLNYLAAVSYANLGMFDRFFDSFFCSYQKAPKEYLAYKAKAVLHTLLLGKATSEEAKAHHKREIFKCAQSALQKEGRDLSLYKMTIVYAGKGEERDVVVHSIKALVEKNIVVPRGDVVFYVEKAASCGEKALALKFLEKAKEWYAYSRGLQEAEDLLVEGGRDHGR